MLKIFSYHVMSFLLSVAAASLASGTTYTFIALMASREGLVQFSACHAIGPIFLMILASTLGAVLFVLPAVLVGYPIALLLAQRISKPTYLACVGAVAGPIIGTGAALSALQLLPPSSLTTWTEKAITLTPIAAMAGAAIGWIVGVRENGRRQ